MSARQKFDSLQIGRGMAAVLVLLFHAGSLLAFNGGEAFAGGAFRFGAAGVDFFFVLSGFIITYRHARDFAHPERLGSYTRRRLVRVYPVYWLVTLAILPLYFVVPGFGQGYETRPDVIATSLILLPANEGPILYVGWSLVHELWFYLVVAALIAFRGAWIRYPVAVWCVAVGCSAFWPGEQPWLSNPWIRVVFSPLNFEFVLGCLAAWIIASPRAASAPKALWVALLISGLVSFFGFGTAHPYFPEPMERYRVLVYGFSSFLIVLGAVAVRPARGLAESSLWKGLVFLGNASYSLYLVHVPVLSAVWKAAEMLGVTRSSGVQPIAWAAVLISVASAVAFHLLIERPLLRRLNSRRPVETAPAVLVSNGS